MSESGGAGRREVAYRLFAAEYDDATFEYSEEDEERAPNYVVTPTGARANRLFVVGVLTEVERVSDDVLRGRIVDPTGAFVVYAGQYQPDPKTFLERAEPPAFVSVTGKARTFTPDGSDRVLTSVRPESINEVDAETRDRWVVGTAAHTVERVATFAEALDRPERGDELRDALLADGVDEGIAEGIALAIDHYGTTDAYLAAVRELAIQAAAVVAGERDEVESLDVAPDEGGPADADLTTAELGATAPSSGEVAAEPDTAADGSIDSETTAAENEPDSESESPEDDVGVDTTGTETTAAETGTATSQPVDPGADVETNGDVADGTTDGDLEGGDGDAAEVDEGTAAASTDDLYELDEEERERVTEEYGTEFTTGSEVDDPGEADIETPQPVEESEPDGVAEEESVAETVEDEGGDVDADTTSEESPDGPDEEPDDSSEDDAAEEADDEPTGDVDLETAVVDTMADLDDGDGANRDEVVAAVVDEHGADPGAVEDAIQDALMSGLCYEPGEDRLKAI